MPPVSEFEFKIRNTCIDIYLTVTPQDPPVCSGAFNQNFLDRLTLFLFQVWRKLAVTPPTSRRGRFSSWWTPCTPWRTLCTTCTASSAPDTLACVPAWPTLTGRSCWPTSAPSASTVRSSASSPSFVLTFVAFFNSLTLRIAAYFTATVRSRSDAMFGKETYSKSKIQFMMLSYWLEFCLIACVVLRCSVFGLLSHRSPLHLAAS